MNLLKRNSRKVNVTLNGASTSVNNESPEKEAEIYKAISEESSTTTTADANKEKDTDSSKGKWFVVFFF